MSLQSRTVSEIVRFVSNNSVTFTSGLEVILSPGLRYVDEIWFVDRCWPSEESDIIKYETGSSIAPPS